MTATTPEAGPEPAPWYREKRWWAAAALVASSVYTPFLLGDLMYVVGREGGLSETTAERLIFWGPPVPRSGGPVARYQWHLFGRYGQGVHDENRANLSRAMIVQVRSRLAWAEGAEAVAARRALTFLEAESGRSDAPL